MNELPPSNPCPRCGAAVPAAAQGLCPRCLLAAVAAPTEPGVPAPQPGAIPTLDELAAAFPDLEVLGLIGAGGMGAVFKARQRTLDRWVALKVLPRNLARDPRFVERFQREARTLARLNHPGIVAIHEFGEAGGFCYLLMEYVDGANLRQALRTGRFSPSQALQLVPQICAALQFAHDAGVTHRDIKPENILLDTSGRVKIADFGIAKLVGRDHPEVALTACDTRLGTPQYMAPEQLERPTDVDHRADIYSLGVVFYELLTGELPLGRFAPPSSKVDLDARIDEIVLRALAKERELRQQSAREVKAEVEGLPACDPRPNAPQGPRLQPARVLRAWIDPVSDTTKRFWLVTLAGLLLLWLQGVIPLAGSLLSQARSWFFFGPRFGLGASLIMGSGLLLLSLLLALLWRHRRFWASLLPPPARELDAWITWLFRGGMLLQLLTWLLDTSSRLQMTANMLHLPREELTALRSISLLGFLLAPLLLVALLGWSLRRELRRRLVGPPLPRPPWVPRLATAFLLLLAVTGVTHAFSLLSGTGAFTSVTDAPAFLVLVTLWSGNRFWRALCLPWSALAAATSVFTCAVWTYQISTTGLEFPADAHPLPFWYAHPYAAGLLGLQAALAPLAAVIALTRPAFRRALGLDPDTGPGLPEPIPAHPAPAS